MMMHTMMRMMMMIVTMKCARTKKWLCLVIYEIKE